MTTQTAHFSWRRIAMLYQFNAPWIRKQTIIYFLFSLATALAYILISSPTIRMGVYNPCRSIITFMFIWSPIVFTKGGDTRIVDRLIPASALEKFVFYMSYLFIVIGLACYLCPWIAEKITLYQPYIVNEENTANVSAVPMIYQWSQYLSTVAAMMTSLYFVIAARHNRIVKAYLISVGVSIFLSTLSTFYGVKEAIISGYKEATDNLSRVNETQIAEMVSSALNDHYHFSMFVFALSVGYILLLMWLTYRALYQRNL